MPGVFFSEREDQPVAVSDHKLSLSVYAILWTVDDICTARAQLVRQRINSRHAEVCVTSAFGSACTNVELIGASDHSDQSLNYSLPQLRNGCDQSLQLGRTDRGAEVKKREGREPGPATGGLLPRPWLRDRSFRVHGLLIFLCSIALCLVRLTTGFRCSVPESHRQRSTATA
jgi:hypothetical protein